MWKRVIPAVAAVSLFFVVNCGSADAGLKGFTWGMVHRYVHTELAEVADISVIHPLDARARVDELLSDYELLEGILSPGRIWVGSCIFIFLDTCDSGGFIPEMKIMGYEGVVYAIDYADVLADAAPPKPDILPAEEFGVFMDEVLTELDTDLLATQIIIGTLHKEKKDDGRPAVWFNAFPVRYDVVNLDSTEGPTRLLETLEMAIGRIEEP